MEKSKEDIRRDVAVLLMKYPVADVLLAMSSVIDEARSLVRGTSDLAEGVSRALRRGIGELPWSCSDKPLVDAYTPLCWGSWGDSGPPTWVTDAVKLVRGGHEPG